MALDGSLKPDVPFGRDVERRLEELAKSGWDACDVLDRAGGRHLVDDPLGRQAVSLQRRDEERIDLQQLRSAPPRPGRFAPTRRPPRPTVRPSP